MPDVVEQQEETGDLVDGTDGFSDSRVFNVRAPSKIQALADLEQVFGVRRGSFYVSPYGESLPMICRQVRVAIITAAPLGGDGHYLVTAEYRGSSSEGQDRNPTPGGPPKYTRRGVQQSGTATVDLFGNPILNSLGQPLRLDFDEAAFLVEVDWYASSDPSNQLLYATMNSVNAELYMGIPPGHGRCLDIGVVPGDELANEVNQQIFYRMRASFLGTKGRQNISPVDQGFQEELTEGAAGLPGVLGYNGKPGDRSPELQPLVLRDGLRRFARPGDQVVRLPEVAQYEPRNWAADWSI